MSAVARRVVSGRGNKLKVRRFPTTERDGHSPRERAAGSATPVSDGAELQHALRVLTEQAAAVHDAAVQLSGELRRFESTRAVLEKKLVASTLAGQPAASVGLTSRQREIAQRLMAGESGQEIALALGITMNTVKSHSKAVLGKLRIHSRHELRYILTLSSFE